MPCALRAGQLLLAPRGGLNSCSSMGALREIVACNLFCTPFHGLLSLFATAWTLEEGSWGKSDSFSFQEPPVAIQGQRRDAPACGFMAPRVQQGCWRVPLQQPASAALSRAVPWSRSPKFPSDEGAAIPD